MEIIFKVFKMQMRQKGMLQCILLNRNIACSVSEY